MDDLFIERTAEFSRSGLYRWRLTRRWTKGPLLSFIMLNPSTADASNDDPTIRRCMSFAQRENAAGIAVANLFAGRATDPHELQKFFDPFGSENNQTLTQLGIKADLQDMPIVCAWGNLGLNYRADQKAKAALSKFNPRLVCLGKTSIGQPRHPLYVKGDQPLVPFTFKEAV